MVSDLPSIKDTLGKEPEVTDLIPSVTRTVDQILNSVIGIRLAEPAVEIIYDILPANVIKNVTGLPKPSELVVPVVEEVKTSIRTKVVSAKPLRLG